MLRALILALAPTLLFVLSAGIQAQDEWPPNDHELLQPGYRHATWTEARWRDGEWEDTRQTRWVYDADGRLVEKEHLSDLGDGLRVSRRELLTYENGVLSLRRMEDRRVNIFAETDSRRYFYDDDGRVSQIEWWAPGPDGSGVQVFEFRYEYDGETVTQTQRQRVDDQLVERTRWVIRSSNGERLSTSKYTFSDGEWVESERVTTEWIDGCPKRRTLSVLHDEVVDWTALTRQVIECDADGRRTSEVSEILVTGSPTPSMRRTYGYDDAGNLIETVFELYRNGDWVAGRRERYSVEPSA